MRKSGRTKSSRKMVSGAAIHEAMLYYQANSRSFIYICAGYPDRSKLDITYLEILGQTSQNKYKSMKKKSFMNYFFLMERENKFCSLVVRVPIHHAEGHGGARRGYVDVDVVSLLYSIGCVLKGTAYQFYIWGPRNCLQLRNTVYFISDTLGMSKILINLTHKMLWLDPGPDYH